MSQVNLYEHDSGPSCIRYPRGNGYGPEALTEFFNYGEAELPGGKVPEEGAAVPVGKGRVIYAGCAEPERKIKASILSIGTRLMEAVKAARSTEAANPDISVAVADARWVKPLDTALLDELARRSDILVTVEEGSAGGFGGKVATYLTDSGALDLGSVRFRSMVVPDIWIEQGPQKDQYDIAGLNAPHIQTKVERLADAVRKYQPRGVLGPMISGSSSATPSMLNLTDQTAGRQI